MARRDGELVEMWYWVATVTVGLLLGIAQVYLLKKMVGVKARRVVIVCLIAKVLLWVAAILGAVAIDELAVVGVVAGVAPVYTIQMIMLWAHKGD